MRSYLALVGLVAALLSGCSMVHSDVARFDQLPQSTAGKSVYFMPLEKQQASAAYRVYADRVAKELAKRGMGRTEDAGTADYGVLMDYGSGGGRQTSGAVPLYGQTGGGTTFQSGTLSTYGAGGSSFGSYSGQSYTTPSFGVVGVMPYTRTEYDRFFVFHMIDLKHSTPDNIVPVYEGRVTSTGKSATFAEVGGCMIQSLFEDFRHSGTDSVRTLTANCQ